MSQHAYATSEDAATVTVIDLETRQAVATLPAGPGAHSVALTPNGNRLYIANRRGRTLTVIDTRAAVASATLELSSPPIGVAVSPDGRRLAVLGSTRLVAWIFDAATGAMQREVTLADESGQPPGGSESGPCSTHPVWSADSASFYAQDNFHARLVRIDAERGTAVALPLLPSPAHMLYLDTAQERIYALCSGDSKAGAPPTVVVIDAPSGAQIASLPVALADGESGELHHATFDADGRRLFVANMGEGRPRGGRSLHVLDTRELQFVARLETRAGAGHPLVSPDGARIYVVNHSSPLISVFDTQSLALVAEVTLPGARSMGHGCFFSDDGSHFWAISNSAGAAYAVDTRSRTVVAQIPTGPGSQDITHSWLDAYA